MIYVREGEIVTCENGHELYEITRDVERFERVSAVQFSPVSIGVPEPVNGEPIPDCPLCGARFHDSETSRFHFKEGWR